MSGRVRAGQNVNETEMNHCLLGLCPKKPKATEVHCSTNSEGERERKRGKLLLHRSSLSLKSPGVRRGNRE